MKTGIELIAQERQEQIEKHGYDVKQDMYYNRYELLQAALFCIDQGIPVGYGLKTEIQWPGNWDTKSKYKIMGKDLVDQLKVAGALIAAEIDRLQNQ